jgi:5-methylcytosine-specific restriction endonuclease McrA
MTDTGTCQLCERGPIELTRHHLVPRSRGGAKGDAAMICPDCHGMLHQLYGEKEIAVRLSTLSALRADERLMKSVRWIAKQPVSRRVTVRRHKRR